MKHSNKFPIDIMSGASIPDRSLIYYPNRDIQCSRAFSQPDNSQNSHFNNAKSWQVLNSAIWPDLDPATQRLWQIFSDAWNLHISSKYATYNPYSSFLAVNYYRRLAGLEAQTTPPKVKNHKQLNVTNIWSPSVQSGGSLIFVGLTTAIKEQSRFLIKTAKPAPSETKIPLSTEHRLINGSNALSVPKFWPGVGLMAITNTSYTELYIEYSYVVITSKVIDADFFPHNDHTQRIRIEKNKFIISKGTIFEWFHAASSGAAVLCASPADEGFHIDTTEDHYSLSTRKDGCFAQFKIPYGIGTVVKRFWLCVKSDTAFNSIDFSFNRFQPGTPENPYIEIATQNYSLSASSQIIELSLTSNYTFTSNQSYFLRVKANISEFGKITLKGFGVHSEERQY